MTLPPPQKLSRYVDPPVDESRVDRVWNRIASSRTEQAPGARFRPVWWVPSLAAASLALALGLVLMRNRPAAPTLTGMVIEGGESGTVTMADGTRLVLEPAARVRWDRVEADHLEATLEAGEVDLDVPHVASRAFVIHAGGFDIVDRGTRFAVSVTAGRVSVSVQSGHVEVRRRDLSEPPRALGAGESWTSGPPMASAPPSSTPPRATDNPPSSDPAEPGTLAAVPSPQAVAKTAGPRELLEAANTARLAGRPRDAAAAFDTLRRRYRTDPRAGLAALELGRLRLDAFGDPRQAVEAFDDAIALAPESTFREDAEARRVEALDQMHSPRCSGARTAYLARYPSGLHSAAVGARCAP
jgi:transmembrane sensor